METSIITGLDDYGKVIEFSSEAQIKEKILEEKSFPIRCSVPDTSKKDHS